MSTNDTLTALFNEIADLMEILGEDGFRINSYRKAARIIHDLDDDVQTMLEDGRLSQVAGVGKSTLEKIEAYLQSGRIALHQELLEKVPQGLPQLLTLQGMGPKTVKTVWEELDIGSIDQLSQAIKDGSLAQLKGFGAKKVQALAQAIEFRRESGNKNLLGEGKLLGEWVIQALKPGKRQILLTEAIRRGQETIGRICITAEGKPHDKLLKKFVRLSPVQAVTHQTETEASALVYYPQLCRQTIQVDLYIVPKERFGAALIHYTGSPAHYTRLRELALEAELELDETGLYDSKQNLIASDSEAAIYEALGMTDIPPALREDRGEIEAARQGQLPRVVRLSDIRGDLHMHTQASDGRSTLEDMAATAHQRGYQYIAITDHSRSSAIANGLDIDRLMENIYAVHEMNTRFSDLTVLASSEVDILADGSLDYPNDVLCQLDFVMASVHSGLGQNEQKNTARIMRAMENPYVNCIGHLTGRMMTVRAGMAVDIQAILKQARATQTALEISSQPLRLDLCDRHIRMAVDMGVKLIINTDAHDLSGLDLIHYGLITAQRGWAQPSDILNTLPIDELLQWIRQKADRFN